MSDRTRATIELAIILALAAALLAVCSPTPARADTPAGAYYEANVPDTIATWAGPVAHYFGPADQARAIAIIRCESNYQRHADNPRSTARGGWQFLRGTWEPLARDLNLDAYPTGPDDPWQATRAAAELVRQYRAAGYPPFAAWLCADAPAVEFGSAQLTATPLETDHSSERHRQPIR